MEGGRRGEGEGETAQEIREDASEKVQCEVNLEQGVGLARCRRHGKGIPGPAF